MADKSSEQYVEPERRFLFPTFDHALVVGWNDQSFTLVYLVVELSRWHSPGSVFSSIVDDFLFNWWYYFGSAAALVSSCTPNFILVRNEESSGSIITFDNDAVSYGFDKTNVKQINEDVEHRSYNVYRVPSSLSTVLDRRSGLYRLGRSRHAFVHLGDTVFA